MWRDGARPSDVHVLKALGASRGSLSPLLSRPDVASAAVGRADSFPRDACGAFAPLPRSRAAGTLKGALADKICGDSGARQVCASLSGFSKGRLDFIGDRLESGVLGAHCIEAGAIVRVVRLELQLVKAPIKFLFVLLPIVVQLFVW